MNSLDALLTAPGARFEAEDDSELVLVDAR